MWRREWQRGLPVVTLMRVVATEEDSAGYRPTLHESGYADESG